MKAYENTKNRWLALCIRLLLLLLASNLHFSCTKPLPPVVFACEAVVIAANGKCSIRYKPIQSHLEVVNKNMIDANGYLKYYNSVNCNALVYKRYVFTCHEKNKRYLTENIAVLNQSFNVHVLGDKDHGFLTESPTK